MKTISPGTGPVLINHEGVLEEELHYSFSANDRPLDARQLAEYAVKNLHFVRLCSNPRGLRVQFRPDRVRPGALARLLYVLSDCRDVRVVLDYFSDGWHHELVGGGAAARNRILALVERATTADASGAVRWRTVEPGTIRGRSPLFDLVESWQSRLGWRDFALFLDRVGERTGQRFVLFEQDRDRADFLFRDFGVGMPEWAKRSLTQFRGRGVADLHADSFGRSCNFAYRQTLEQFAPTVQMVDATVRWPGYATLRRRYWRALLPLSDPAGRLWLLSASLPDADIDLRKAG